jgi:hypothetical protein
MNRLIKDSIKAYKDEQLKIDEMNRTQAFKALEQVFGEYVDDSIERTSDPNVFKIRDTDYILGYDSVRSHCNRPCFHLYNGKYIEGSIRSLSDLGNIIIDLESSEPKKPVNNPVKNFLFKFKRMFNI